LNPSNMNRDQHVWQNSEKLTWDGRILKVFKCTPLPPFSQHNNLWVPHFCPIQVLHKKCSTEATSGIDHRSLSE
jgi:hypothetical protein